MEKPNIDKRMPNTAGCKGRRKPVKPADYCRIREPEEKLDRDYALLQEQRERVFANRTLHPTESSATTLRKVLEKGDCYLPDLKPSALTSELTSQCEAVSNGDMRRPEALLMTQAQTLDLIFNDLIQRFYGKVGSLELGEPLLRLAFKAQSQSRATIETLFLAKNPPSATFVNQANVTTGPQQINNNSVSRARKTKSRQNELMEEANGQRLESSAASDAGRRNSEMAPLGEFHRAKKR